MTTTTDKGKSLGEKLHDAGVRGYQAKSVWRDLPDATKAQMEKTALAFVASLSDNASLKAAEARAIAAEEALKAGWSTDAPPMRRDAWIEVRGVDVYRWLPYKPDGARQMKKAGRWQKHDGYGFTNAELPEGAEWRPVSSTDAQS